MGSLESFIEPEKYISRPLFFWRGFRMMSNAYTSSDHPLTIPDALFEGDISTGCLQVGVFRRQSAKLPLLMRPDV